MKTIDNIESHESPKTENASGGRRLKIVHCLFTFATGGAQVLALELLNEMSNFHDVSLIIMNNTVNPALIAQLKPGIPVHYLNRKEGNPNPWPVIRLNLLLMKIKPDIVHCHEPKMAKAIRVKYPALVHTIHDVGIEKTFYHLYDSLVAISDAVYNDVQGDFPKTKKIYNGIPLQLFNTREQFGLLPDEPFRLVQLSRLMHEKKGQDILIRALHLLQSTKTGREIRLDLIGSGSSEAYLRGLVKELGLEDRVCFAGEKNRDWLYENLRYYHALIQPSRYEGFGLTILEGFAAGLPVIASDIDGPAEIINQTPGGFLFADGDESACANEITRLIEKYENKSISVSMDETLGIINEKYSVQNCTKEYLSEYNRLIKA
ncbi:MAG: glycosyltransferase [Chitinophagaceae bacterium]